MSKYLELAKKLKALAEQGVGGEKYNAKLKLNKLLVKHKITRSQLDEDQREWNEFKVPKSKRHLLFQVVDSILGENFKTYKRKGTSVYIETTKAEVIEINSKLDFYWRAYLEEIEVLFTAFVIKHKLFDPLKIQKESKLTLEEIDLLKRSIEMANSLKSKYFFKSIVA